MGEAPCIPAPRRAAAAPHCFRLARHGRRKVHVVRLGGGGRVQARGRGGLRLRRWLSRAVWRLAELCVAALSSGPPSGGGRVASAKTAPWAGIEPCFAAPFVPVALMKRAEAER
ncbi:hypothetical protein PR202_gb15510 [Eleusine coracana subsp. coracana]|uniref:Uncharacterized protein n=1 Tax=Eleusine coracana subsp. coracana TaxID=191504 RepID=A0AAV5EXB1_ELECO|nr:hypothetical protein PR202_gb15510 [Eleusine coracana subsp. coracana]